MVFRNGRLYQGIGIRAPVAAIETGFMPFGLFAYTVYAYSVTTMDSPADQGIISTVNLAQKACPVSFDSSPYTFYPTET